MGRNEKLLTEARKRAIVREYERLRWCVKLVGSRNWWEGVDRVSLMDRLWRRRISLRTAWEVACILAGG